MEVSTKKLVPLYKVVAQAMIDMYSDISHAGVEQMFQLWAVRGYQKLADEVLRTGVIKTILKVNKNTNTATLPLGFKEETFIGIINHYNQKVPIRINSAITDTENIEEIEFEDICPKCSANKAICQDLQVTEDTILVMINNTPYEQTVIKKLYPDGRYYLETKTPVLNLETNLVEFTTQKEFIATISLKPCGCVEENEQNISVIKTCCPDIYCSYFAPCSNVTLDAGYKIFEESGLIQFDQKFNFNKIYLEYRGSIIKKNGQYQVPEICFETLVNWIKFKSVENKKGVALSERNWFWERYLIERGNMEKIIGRLSLIEILQAVNRLPKFDFDFVLESNCCPVSPPTLIPAALPIKNDCADNNSTSVCPPISGKSFVPFEYAGIVGIGDSPRNDLSTYQNDKFKNAMGINVIMIDNTTYTKLKGDFDVDTTTGILSIAPNKFIDGSSLVVPTFFKLI